MKILHTSDWHLGRSLYGRKRYDEFEAFLNWLAVFIRDERIDVLLVAGDVFDTSLPSNRAQALYYRFLGRVSGTCCRHIVVTAGNHDSPSFLSAPHDLLKAMNIFVVGAIGEKPEDEVIVLTDMEDRPEAIVCAVPHLRDKDIRMVFPNETAEDKNAKLVEGIRNHYAAVCDAAALRQAEFKEKGYGHIPVIAMGHLFTARGKTVEGDGVRELYVGSLAHVDQRVFPPIIDYLALGHLHVAQRVADNDNQRYSGSPIPMGFGEAGQSKQVVLVTFGHGELVVQERLVPCFQRLERVFGTLDELRAKIDRLKEAKERIWLEVEYNGGEMVGNLREAVDGMVGDASLDIIRIKNKRMADGVVMVGEEDDILEAMDVNDVFSRCLDAFSVDEKERDELISAYTEILRSFDDEDPNAD